MRKAFRHDPAVPSHMPTVVTLALGSQSQTKLGLLTGLLSEVQVQ